MSKTKKNKETAFSVSRIHKIPILAIFSLFLFFLAQFLIILRRYYTLFLRKKIHCFFPHDPIFNLHSTFPSFALFFIN